jgi:glycosyltransferase involved in cell wall biosynthesis
MNVLVLSNMLPFVHGGAEELAANLVLNLQRRGVDAEAMALPFSWDPPERLIEEMLIARSLRITNVDRVIALKFPAYLVEHPNRCVWLLHQYRQAYDLRVAGQTNLGFDARGDAIQAAIQTADTASLGSAQRLYTNSSVTSGRLRRFNGLNSTVLPPPLNDPELFTEAPSDGYILASGRVGEGKRQHLLIEAAAQVPGLRLVIAGPPDTAEYAAKLRDLLARHDLAARVQLDLRFLPRAELGRLVSACQAVAYLPFDEDSLGYVSMEACHAGKPIITTTDSGGILELAVDGQTGWVCAPDPEQLAQVLRDASTQTETARKRGAAAHEAFQSRGLNWNTTIDMLLA